ncbi:MAG TPA: alpha/beta fold hydrolase [Gemmatimonadaceae bacterium]|nr:alpha/beta fold hydrolase [Gemmatimonadaceae bacterium]
MQTIPVQFPGATGATLSARLEMPLDGDPIAYALFAHCFTCSKNFKATVTISRALAQARIAVLRLDFTGLGESEGAFEETTFSTSVDDLLAGAAWLDEHHAAPQLLVGHSLGGAAALHAAARLPSVKAVVTINAPSEPAHVLELLDASVEEIERRGEARATLGGRRFTIRKEFLDDVGDARMLDVVRSLRAALLIFHAPSDQIVGIDNAARLYTAARHPKSFVSLDDADHLLSDEQDARYVGDVLAAWVRRYLDRGQRAHETMEQVEADNRVVARTGEGYRTAILASGHALIADEPVAVGGSELGPTPYDLLAAALGACTSMTLQMYARRKQWPLDEAIVRLRHSKIHALDERNCESGAAKMDRLDRTVELVGDLTADQRARLLEIANKCPVHRTLEAGVVVETELEGARG